MVSWTLFGLFLIQVGVDFKNQKTDLIKKIFFSPVVIIANLFFISMSISAFLSPIESISVYKAINVNRALLLFPAFAYMWRFEFLKFDKKFFNFIFSLLFFVSLYAIYQFFTSQDFVRGANNPMEEQGQFFRPEGFFANPLTFAYSLGMCWFVLLPVCEYYILQKQKQKAFIYGLVLLVAGLALLATSARGAWVGMLLSLLIYLSVQKNKKIVIVSFAILVVSILTMLSHSTFRDRIKSIVDPTNISNSDRFAIWRANWDLIQENIIWGVGYNVNTTHIADRYEKLHLPLPHAGPEHHAHSDILQAFAGGGLFGVSLYLLLILSFLFLSFKNWQKMTEQDGMQKGLALGLFLAQVFVHLGGLTQCNYTDREVNHMLTFIWAFTLVQYIQSNMVAKNDLLEL